MKARGHWVSRNSRESRSPRSGGTHSKPQSTKELLASYLEVFNKAAPLALLFGALLLMGYLKNNNLPDVFLASVSSPQGLITFSIGSFIVTLVTVLALLFPPLIAAVMKGVVKEELNVAVPWWFAGVMFCLFFVLLLEFDPRSLLIVIARAFVAILMIGLWLRWGWEQDTKGWLFATGVLLLCMLLVVLPLQMILSGAKYYGNTYIELFIFWFVYLMIAGLVVSVVLNGKDMKIYMGLLAFGGMLAVMIVIGYSDFITNRAAVLLGMRHDDVRWYWVSLESSKRLISNGMCLAKRGEENYIAARSPFMLGDTRVLCNCVGFESSEGKPPNACNVSNKDACVVLEKSEVRAIDSQHFEGDSARCLLCDMPQSGVESTQSLR